MIRAIRSALVPLAALSVAASLAGCEPLSSAELQREVESIGSVSAEAAVLADRIAEQETKRTFARVQARELGDAAGHSAERLEDADPAEGLDDAVERAIALAESVADEAGQLEVAPDSAAEAMEAAERLRALSEDATQLAGSL